MLIDFFRFAFFYFEFSKTYIYYNIILVNTISSDFLITVDHVYISVYLFLQGTCNIYYIILYYNIYYKDEFLDPILRDSQSSGNVWAYASPGQNWLNQDSYHLYKFILKVYKLHYRRTLRQKIGVIENQLLIEKRKFDKTNRWKNIMTFITHTIRIVCVASTFEPCKFKISLDLDNECFSDNFLSVNFIKWDS